MKNINDIPPFSVVEGYKNLIRDEKTKAVLNTNLNEYENYKKMREIKDSEMKRIDSLERDLDTLKDNINEIKMLLRNIANGPK